ncbi:4Fe-4S dicluster domain-containing protein [Dehalogenimonas sp. THU2]|uniref:4Fe-4S dicluster domain-containing protein n=1 Tax=Dehalogenimonas sp. THU2 TaxID=3151121 RepID=UPI003218A2DD
MTENGEQGTTFSEANPKRREFLKLAGAALALAAVAEVSDRTQRITAAVGPPAEIKQFPIDTIFSGSQQQDVLIRMQNEVRRAMTRPMEERHWSMVINLRKCIGCHACTEACISENKLPSGVVYRFVMDEETGSYPNLSRRFTPRPCMHCDNPPCTKVCPVGATYKQADGIVVIDYDRCIGCRFCIVSCPYTARVMDYGDDYLRGTPDVPGLIVGKEQAAVWEQAANFEYATKRERSEKRDSPIGNARKCHFCLHRLENGMLPACVTTCIGRVNTFGDSNDPDGLVSELLADPGIIQLKPELGTKPSVHYLF